MKIKCKEEWYCAECGATLKADPERPNVSKHPDVSCTYRNQSVIIPQTFMDVKCFREP